ncbi:SDR family NAD(P)-dependent oxidoreductase, partial [Acidicapsa ligni]|uniref:SDR family NAD(P)-dependent oxidoreductase n=1 Tax=Acidicapsa ligni TaxID=542300 RepID=UPI0021DFB3E5
CWSHVRTRRIDSSTLAADLTITHPNGSAIAHVKNIRFRKNVTKKNGAAIYQVEWKPAEDDPSAPKIAVNSIHGHWLVLAEKSVFAEQVVQEIRQRNAVCSFLPIRQRDESDVALGLRTSIAASGPIQGIIYLSPGTPLFKDVAGQVTELEMLSGYAGALSLLKALIREQVKPDHGVWFVTQNEEQTNDGSITLSSEGSVIAALRRVAALEFAALRTHAIDIAITLSIEDLLRAIETETEPEIAIRNGVSFYPYLLPQGSSEESIATETNEELRAASSGLIDDLAYVPVPRQEPQKDEVEIQVEAQGLNFRDVMNALGMLPGYPQQLGGECAGIVCRAGINSGFNIGDRVFAYAPRSFSAFVTVSGRNVKALPKRLTPAQASVLPIAYLTALYGLDTLAKLKRGERVLIHAATGGLGLAAVFVARARGAEVFATAGSEEKRNHLRSLGIQNVFHSRTSEFATQIIQATQGLGVDVVLNSLTGQLAESTLSTLALNGRFLEVGKRDILTREEILRLRPDVQHYVYDLGTEAERDLTLVPTLLSETVEMIEEGQLPPLPVTEFRDMHEAFRFMAQARHIGKISVCRIPLNTNTDPVATDPKATYLITGGCGGLGLHFAEWLINRGARHLILSSRRGASSSARERIEALKISGAEIQIASVDVSDYEALGSLLRSIPSATPLKGVLHAAGSIADNALINQTVAGFAEVARPKVLGAWNLHRLTKNIDLDFFVLFSSASVLLGVPGQANYAAANAMLDAFATYRRGLGLPALSIQWGPWSSGMMESMKSDPKRVGLDWISPVDGKKALELLLVKDATVAAVLSVSSWPKFVSSRSKNASSLFKYLDGADVTKAAVPQNNIVSETENPAKFIDMLINSQQARRAPLLTAHLEQQLTQILSLPQRSHIDEDIALHDLGLDSLMAVELRNALQISLDRPLSATLALDYPTVRSLRDILLSLIFDEKELLARAVKVSPADQRTYSSDYLAELSDIEAESLLIEELEKTNAAKH